MQSETIRRLGVRLYIGVFFLYLLIPLSIMSLATFNDSRFPTVYPWKGFTLKWCSALVQDMRMWQALWTSIVVAIGVLVVAVPIGICCALFLSTVQGKGKTLIYSMMMSPLLTPGIIIGISTLIFWKHFDVTGGIVLTVIAQTTFIAAYVMLMVLARLQRFDRTFENAALSLGATQWQTFRRILLPYLKPAVISAAGLAFLQSFENYHTTLFVRGSDSTLTLYIATKVRLGSTPAVNALGLVMIVLTVMLAIVYAIKRRRALAIL